MRHEDVVIMSVGRRGAMTRCTLGGAKERKITNMFAQSSITHVQVTIFNTTTLSISANFVCWKNCTCKFIRESNLPFFCNGFGGLRLAEFVLVLTAVKPFAFTFLFASDEVVAFDSTSLKPASNRENKLLANFSLCCCKQKNKG